MGDGGEIACFSRGFLDNLAEGPSRRLRVVAHGCDLLTAKLSHVSVLGNRKIQPSAPCCSSQCSDVSRFGSAKTIKLSLCARSGKWARVLRLGREDQTRRHLWGASGGGPNADPPSRPIRWRENIFSPAGFRTQRSMDSVWRHLSGGSFMLKISLNGNANSWSSNRRISPSSPEPKQHFPLRRMSAGTVEITSKRPLLSPLTYLTAYPFSLSRLCSVEL